MSDPLQITNKPPKNILTYTFGCKVNLFDTVAMENDLQKQLNCTVGHKNDRKNQKPDVVIVNTCTVTSSADRQARQLIRRVHREYPNAKIVVTGCYAQAKPQTIKAIEGVTFILPISEQRKLPVLLGASFEADKNWEPTPKFSIRTRAYLKMQEGCNAYCSFCVLPYIRGRSSSIPLAMLCRLAQGYEKNGYREIVVTGTHIGAYGRELQPRIRFSEALQAIANAAPHTSIRVSSLEPTTLTPDVIRLVSQNHQFRPHFHIPLQSGSDAVLRRMNRKYRIKNYEERVTALALTRERVSIGADVIVGFPGETPEEFFETYELAEKLPLTYLHVFPFSARPNTRAETFVDDVPAQTKKNRVKALRNLSREKQTRFFTHFLGKTVSVLVEKKRDALGFLCGHSPHYIPVRLKGPERLMEKEIDVRLLELYPGKTEGLTLFGEAA